MLIYVEGTKTIVAGASILDGTMGGCSANTGT